MSKRTSAARRTDPGAARQTAITFLARRDLATGELYARLLSKGYSAEIVESLISDLTRDRLLDDERYAQHYVAYHAGRGQGPIRIAAELRRHGVPAALIEAALEGGPDWRALASKVCRAKFGLQPPSNWAQRARQARFLQYRGFSADHIRAATGVEPDAELEQD